MRGALMKPTGLRSWILSLAISVTTLTLIETAEAASWTEWEVKNSVARERDWLVIKGPSCRRGWADPHPQDHGACVGCRRFCSIPSAV